MAARKQFVVVAVAASAGGIPALSQLLASLPPDFGAAMLVMQHLAPSRPSLLVEILRRLTTVPVREAHQADAIRSVKS